MISLLRKLFPSRFLFDTLKHEPQIQGHLTLETRERGKLYQRESGFNIWTLTGREYLGQLIALESRNPARTTFRDDRIAYIGLGTGSQPEVSNITSLVDPVPYSTGEFLASLSLPAEFPTPTTKTSVKFIREFAYTEVSLGFDVVVTEAGLFTDGDPDNNWDLLSTPTSFAGASGRAPMAYKTIAPVTKTMSRTMRAEWEVRFI